MRWPASRSFSGRSAGGDLIAAQDERALDRVLELAHVAGPGVAGERVARVSASAGAERPCSSAVEAREVLGERHDLGRAIAQRRHDEREAADAEQQVLAEPAGADLGFEVAVRRGDEARVGRDFGRAADARDHLALEDAQQLGLERERHLADLVEEQRAAVGRLEEADLAACRRR